MGVECCDSGWRGSLVWMWVSMYFGVEDVDIFSVWYAIVILLVQLSTVTK